MGHWAVYWISIDCFIQLFVQTLKTLIVIYRMGNFVCHLWEFTSIYRQLSYPFRSLVILPLSYEGCTSILPSLPSPSLDIVLTNLNECYVSFMNNVILVFQDFEYLRIFRHSIWYKNSRYYSGEKGSVIEK